MKHVSEVSAQQELASDRQPATASSQPLSFDRRTAIKWVIAAASAAHLPTFTNAVFADTPPHAHGYGKDPKLTHPYHAGEVWPLTLSAQQRKTARVLSDL